MNNFSNKKIFISLKISPKRQDDTFSPLIHFQEACYIFLKKLYLLLENDKTCEDIHPLLGEILIVLSGDKQSDYLHALKLFSQYKMILKQCNEIYKHSNWNFILKLSIAVDSGRANKITIPKTGSFPKATTWTGIHQERASLISHTIENSIYPDTLITHAFYKNLPPKVKENYVRLYYFHHICCYSIQSEHIA